MLTLLAASLIAMPFQAEEMRLMRMPDIHGDQIVFTYAGDLWLANRTGGLARRLTSHPGAESGAQFSPDGKWIAFNASYDGMPDIYVIPSEGGEPKRLTYEPDPDGVVSWTPDGKIAYKSSFGTFNGQMQMLWSVDPAGGPSTRTPIQEIADGSFSADGKSIAYNRAASHQFNWRRYRGGTHGFVSIYNLSDNTYSELPHKRENSWFPMWVGDAIYYASDRNQGTVNLYRYDLKSKQDKQLTTFADADIKWPKTDGKTIVYERDGAIYTYDIASGKIEKFSAKVASDNVAARPVLKNLNPYITDLAISPSGARVLIEARGELFSVPQKNGETRNVSNTASSRERCPAWSPDGQTLAYVSDATGEWEVYTMPQMGGKATQLTDGAKIPATSIQWFPDGKKLLITTRNSKLFVLDVESRKLTLVLHGNFGLGSWDISPDSKWIAYVNQQKNYLGAVYLYEIATGKATQVTDGYYDDSAVSFDMGGKYLYIVSARTFAPVNGKYELAMAPMNTDRIYVIPLAKDTPNPQYPKPDEEKVKEEPKKPDPAKPEAGAKPAEAPKDDKDVKIDFDGLAARAIPLPMSNSSYPMILGSTNGVFFMSGGGFMKYDLGSPAPAMIMQGGFSAASVNATRTKAAFVSGSAVSILDLAPGAQPKRVDTSDVAAVIDLPTEWKQMYWEVWRYMRDNFYDPQMAGVDWKSVGAQYAKYLPYVKHRSDLSYVFGLMIGELGTGHAYVGGGDMGPSSPPVPVGMLGCDYAIEGDFVKISKIYAGANYDESRRSPFMDPGVNVKEGDYLLEIDGKPVTKSVNPASLLLRRSGKSVVVTVNDKPTLEGARHERVRPIGSEDELRYWSWVEETRAKVAAASGGKIGYMHIPDTAVQGTTEFMRGFWSQTGKDAVIVDERWNGGGFIQPWFVDTLSRKVMAAFTGNNFAGGSVPDGVAIEGPKAMLINQYAGSGGDFFPWMFRQAGLGPLIGKRTWGGLVGINGLSNLADGGGVSVPEFGIYDKDLGEWIAENKGIDPDIDVDLRPDLLAKGQDPQLEKAIEYLLDQLKKHPAKGFKTPPYPKTVPPKTGG
ncbi:MAG: PD40 domain-containing protein [Armatimonadetes bacterium]|nr:PD40 domain-containing protein [Armatimonadota bacterium]